MAKKIYDIKPPKIARKVEKQIKDFLTEDKKQKPTRHKKEGFSIWWSVSIAAVLIMLVVGVYLFFKLPKAEIAIWPKVETLGFKQTVTADKSIETADSIKGIVPAKYFETSKTVSQDFPATGNASNEGRASGTITVYNKLNPTTSFTLKTGTHFLSDSGKLFVASKKIVVPAGKKSGSKVTPGSIEVEIQAVEGGDSYNIAPSNFSIPGLKGTAYYYNIYASSSNAMTGGYAGKVKKVTDDDIQGAKSVLIEKVTSDAKTDLKNQISSDYVLLDNAISSTTIEASTQTKSGTTTDNFTYKVIVKVSALAFKKSDLDNFAKDYITSQIEDGQTILDGSFKTNYSASTVDVSGGTAKIDLDFSSGVYKNIDRNSLAMSLLGKNENQIKETINSRLGDQVFDLKVKFWPFWVNKAPASQKAVSVDLKFE